MNDDVAWTHAFELVKEILHSQPHLTAPMTPNANTGRLVAEFISGMHAELMAYMKKRPPIPG
ncbi:MAG TPA: hypothetical protein VEG37_03660 [Burkholderiales bacterium]|nr:hypothetical protein [Burkholderiales bacterium]